MIYKPTDLSPSAQTFDVKDTPIFFECKVDTSNVQARGFTIKVLDSENNVVFSSIPEDKTLDIKYVTLIDELRKYVGDGSSVVYSGQEVVGKFASYVEGYNLVNTGYNGTYLKFPFSVAFADRAQNTVGINQIFYSETSVGGVTSPSGLYRYTQTAIDQKTYDAYRPVEIYNGQEYKWSITLYQLENFGDDRNPDWRLPENPLYYDMPLTIGTVLGSNNIRIQGVYSDEIYSDYFVQPVKINNLKFDADNPTQWTYTPLDSNGNETTSVNEDEEKTISQNDSNRVMIKSYDSTYGYIYPMTGEDGFSDKTIVPDNANGFRVYKRGNKDEDLSVYRKVVYVLESALDTLVADKWIGDSSYTVGQLAAYQSTVYQCSSATSGSSIPPSSDSSHWTDYYGASWMWSDSLANPGEAYGIYTFYSDTDPNGIYYINGKSFVGGERTILNAQVSKASYSNGKYIGSPYNGIYYPEFAVSKAEEYNGGTNYYEGDRVTFSNVVYSCTGIVKGVQPGVGAIWNKYWKQIQDPGSTLAYNNNTSYHANDNVSVTINNETQYFTCTGVVYGVSPPNSLYWEVKSGVPNYKITARWLRTPDADSWGELMNKIVLVTDGASDYCGKNLQIQDINDNADAYGTINETPFIFVPEKPIEIYKKNYPSYESGREYKQGEIVTYVKKGKNYRQYDANITYSAGNVVYDSNKIYYICIQKNRNNSLSNTKYWVKYKALGYYIAIIDSSNESPINSNGTLNDDYWAENPYLGNTGVIFYNNQLGEIDPISSTESSTDSTMGRLYIRRFEGIQPGMLLMKNSNNNIQQYVNVRSYNSDYNFITYDKTYTFDTYESYYRDSSNAISSSHEQSNPYYSSSIDINGGWEPANQVGAGTKYQIKTFFRESDENAFYFYTAPVVTLHYANPNGVDFIEDRALTQKYYADYVGYISSYNPTGFYAIGDICKTSYDGDSSYWEALVDNPQYAPGSSSWENVTSVWKEQSSNEADNYTIAYNRYFSYNKDDIVLYDNKRDFLLYNIDYEYSYGDKVRDTDYNYYISIKNHNLGNDDLTDEEWWKPAIIDDSYDTNIQYIALTNVPVGYAPRQENIGVYWQQYVGVLFEDEGYVSASFYYNNVKYESSTDVLYNGLYFTVAKNNESYVPDESLVNEHNERVWEKTKTYSSTDVYTEGVFEWGAPVNNVDQLGKLCKYDGLSWDLYTGSYKEIDYLNGLGLSSNELLTTFNSNNVYLKTADVFYEGYKYTVIADTSIHVPKFDVSSTEDAFFIRNDKGRPLNYPNSIIKSWRFTSGGSTDVPLSSKKKYLMGDIVLTKGSSTDCLPDRYWVKIANTDSTDPTTFDVDQFVPNQNIWQPYYGAIFAGNGFDQAVSYKYNNVILDEEESGLYFIKKNIDEAYATMGPVSPLSLSAWSVAATYVQGDKVVYENVIYICKAQEASGQRPATDSSIWDIYPWQLYIPEITERTLRVSAKYDQQQYVQWKSAQWFLFDAEGENILEKSDVFYDGDLSYTFHGLNGRDPIKNQDKFFIVRLILETYNGYRMIVDETIETMFEVTEMDSEGLIYVTFDCDTASVVTTITKESGFIVPSDVANATYEETTAGNVNEGVMHLDGLMRYQKVAAAIENASEISKAKPILSAAERFVQQIDLEIKTDTFGGELFGLRSYLGDNDDADNEDSAQSKLVGDFSIYIPEFLKYINGKNIYPNDSVLSQEKFITLNEYRNYLRWISNQPGTPYSDGVRIVENDGANYPNITENGDLTQFHNYKPYRTVPIYQKSGFNNSVYSETNYLPIDYEFTISSSQEELQEKYLNINLKYSSYRDSSDFTRDSSFDGSFYPEQNFYLIQDPLIKENQFIEGSIEYFSPNADSTEFETAIFETTSDDGSYDAIRTHSKTITMWSDYVFKAPNAVLVGNTGISWEDNPIGTISNTEYFTRKNVWDTVGWKWIDGTDSNDVFWIDADYMTSWRGYQTRLGGVSINGKPVADYEVWFNEEDVLDVYSNTYFKPQKPLNPVFTERKYLNNKKFLFDIDLTMDADGFITPTTIEDIAPESDGYLKVVAYSHINSDTEDTINNNNNN